MMMTTTMMTVIDNNVDGGGGGDGDDVGVDEGVGGGGYGGGDECASRVAGRMPHRNTSMSIGRARTGLREAAVSKFWCTSNH